MSPDDDDDSQMGEVLQSFFRAAKSVDPPSACTVTIPYRTVAAQGYVLFCQNELGSISHLYAFPRSWGYTYPTSLSPAFIRAFGHSFDPKVRLPGPRPKG
jgi:hypothetical protein